MILTASLLASIAVLSCSARPDLNGVAAWAADPVSSSTGAPASTGTPDQEKPSPSVSSTKTDTPTADVSAVAAPSSATQTPEKRIATPACNGRFGRLEQARLTAAYLPLPMDVRVYLPPCYSRALDAHYPVLYLIHGQNFDEGQWDRLEADETADRLIAGRQVNPFIIVMPHDAVLRDPQDSPFRRAFVELLIPWVEKNYRTINDRNHRAIGGLSRGGAWALYLGLSHYELFSAIGMHSSFFFNGEEYPTRNWLQTIPVEDLPRLFLDIGSEDHLIQANRELEKLLMKNNVSYEYYLFPGRHEEIYWTSHMEQYLRWYAREW